MKIIIFGSNGMLGRYVTTYLKMNHDIIPIDRNQYDVLKSTFDDLDIFLKKLLSNSDDETIIINCIGIIPQRTQTNEPEKFLYINSVFPHLLNSFAKKNLCKLIHITTDCVFDGRKGNYNENDEHTEKNIYGVSKSLGEPLTATVIRTSIIGEELENKKSLLEWVKKQDNSNIFGYDNHFWNGVTCLQLSKIIAIIINNKLYWTGVRHIYSPISVSKYELINLICDIYGLHITLNHHHTINLCDKTLSTIYDTNSYFNIPGLREQIIEQKKYSINYLKY